MALDATIAVAISDAQQPALSRVFVAYNLSSQHTDWNAVPWVDCGTRETIHLKAIRVLDEGESKLEKRSRFHAVRSRWYCQPHLPHSG